MMLICRQVKTHNGISKPSLPYIGIEIYKDTAEIWKREATFEAKALLSRGWRQRGAGTTAPSLGNLTPLSGKN